MKGNKLVLGLDIGGTNISSGLNREGKIFERIETSTPSSSPKEKILEAISNQIARYLKYDFKAIGIGIPGLVDPVDGIVYNLANIPSFQKVNLKSYLEAAFKVPVIINNDANCFALGEYKFGPAKIHRHVVGITLGTGIGTGVIANSHLYTGQLCGAGEWGAVPYKDKTFEDYCSSKFFKSYYQESSKKLAKMAEEKDEKALAIFEDYGKHLGVLINHILYIYAPEAIVIGGSIRKAYPFFEKSMMTTINQFPYKPISSNLKIYVSQLEDSAILGAISLHDENNFMIKSERLSGTTSLA
ncbi:MAG: ROK family protein [Cyclobacteriaceae bacterium]